MEAKAQADHYGFTIPLSTYSSKYMESPLNQITCVYLPSTSLLGQTLTFINCEVG